MRDPRRPNNKFTMVAVLLVICGLIAYGAKNNLMQNFIPATYTKDAIEKIIEEKIKKDPELIIKAVTDYQEEKMKEQEARSQMALKQSIGDLQNTDFEPYAGNVNSKNKIYVFLDYHCKYCRSFQKTLDELITKDDDLKVVFKEFPILGEESEKLSRIALAVFITDANKYAKFHSLLMTKEKINPDNLDELIKEVGLDPKTVKINSTDGKISLEFEKNKIFAQKIGINGVPAMIIGEEMIPAGGMRLEEIQDKIKQIKKDN